MTNAGTHKAFIVVLLLRAILEQDRQIQEKRKYGNGLSNRARPKQPRASKRSQTSQQPRCQRSEFLFICLANVRFQPRRPMITPAAAGYKSLLGIGPTKAATRSRSRAGDPKGV